MAREERFKAAVKLLDDAEFAFDRLASEFWAGQGTSEIVRDFIVTAAVETEQSVRHYDRLTLMQSKLDAERAEMEDLESDHFDARLTFARQALGANITTVVDVKNTVNIRNSTPVRVLDQEMDEVTKLLQTLPQAPERDKALTDPQNAKDEKDIASKIKKGAAVIDATAKLANGAAKLVPYGLVVMGVLKGIFAMKMDDTEREGAAPGSSLA